MEEDEMMSPLISLQHQDQDQDQGEEEGGEDRISGLPDAIIHHILSFLPTKDAIATGLLSTRWKCLWTSVPNLTFTYQSESTPKFINKTLALYSSNKINKFSLEISLDDCLDILETALGKSENIDSLEQLQCAVSSWLQFATIRQMEELSLEVYAEDYTDDDANFVMPQFLYRHPWFAKIVTSYCDYPSPSAGVRWGLLKELIIKNARFKDGALQMVLLGTPLLECLELRMCSYFPNIDTTSNLRLKRLVLEQVRNDPESNEFRIMEISIPNVTSLEILGAWRRTRFNLLTVSSLVDVTLDFTTRVGTHSECCHWVWQLLENVQHSNKLTIGTWCIQVLSLAMVKAFCPPLPNNNWTCLTLATRFEKWDFIGVGSLLHSSPCLERLVLDQSGRRDHSLKVKYRVAKDHLASQVGSFYCLQRAVKTIQLVGLGRPQGYLLKFIKFLLRSAKVLEKLVTVAPRPQGRDTHFNLNAQSIMMDNYYGCCQLLLSFPKSSPQVLVLLT